MIAELRYCKSEFGVDLSRSSGPRDLLAAELGLPIGSGTVESACKNVVAARMKQSGMMWGMPGATGMLQLRASLKSRRFRRDHERLLPFSPPRQSERMAA